MDILLSGYFGAMGQNIVTLAEDKRYAVTIAAGIDKNTGCEADVPVYTDFDAVRTKADMIIDFSHRSLTLPLLDYAVKQHLPLVLATTGHTEDEVSAIHTAAGTIPVFYAANYSLGIALLIELARKTVAAIPGAEIEIIEKHHSRKMDAPSGTALSIAKALKEVRPGLYENCGRSGMGKRNPDEIGIHAIRMGNVVGEHEVIVATPLQTITLKHEAHSRALFAEGALTAADFLKDKPAGLYTMNDLIAQ